MAQIGSSGDFMTKFIDSHTVPKDALEHFTAQAWLQPYLSDASYKSIPTFASLTGPADETRFGILRRASRVLKDTGEDFFFARTVATEKTIPHLLSLQLVDLATPAETPKGTSLPTKDHKATTEVPAKPDCIFLLKLARPGLDGHPGVTHGGMNCAILDEMMGLCVILHQQQQEGPRNSLFTVNLNITYRAPVPTPSDILVRCWLKARQGRKWLSIGQITDKAGNVLCEADGLWVLTKRETDTKL